MRLPCWRLRYLSYSISNLFYYFTTIWNDRDWDGDYYYYLLLRKIQRQRKRYQEHDYFVGQNYVIVQMRACEILLERLISGWYVKQINWDIENDYKKWTDREMKEQELLFKILSQYIRHWWD